MKRGFRSVLPARTGGCLLLAVLLGACAGHTPPPAQRAAATNGPAGSEGQRLQALESRVDLLTQRLDQLQAASGNPLAGPSAAPLPVELRPIRPQLVLSPQASRPVSAAPATPPPQSPPEPPPQRQPTRPAPRHGGWVINLASYNSRHYAAGKQAEFVAAGVPAEQVEAHVHGATVYRLRVSGFASYRTASAEAEDIRARLGLQHTWIARR